MNKAFTMARWSAWILLAAAELIGLILASFSQGFAIVSKERYIDYVENHTFEFILRRLLYAALISLVLSGLVWIIYYLLTGPLKVQLLETRKSKLFMIQWAVFFVLSGIGLAWLVAAYS